MMSAPPTAQGADTGPRADELRPSSLVVSRELIQLREDGYAVLKQPFNRAHMEALVEKVEELWAAETAADMKLTYSEGGVRRLEDLHRKGEIFIATMMDPRILEVGAQLVNEPLRLSMLKARDPLPGCARQEYHRDCTPPGLPDQLGYYSFTAILALDEFTRENGGTVLVPGSQKWPYDVSTMDDILKPHPEEITVCADRGDVILLNGHTWHAGASNQSLGSRRAILMHYYAERIETSGRFKPEVGPEIRATVSPETLRVLGARE